MKILNTITAYPPSIGGAQIHQHILNQNLRKNHQIQVVSHWDANRNDWLRGTTINAPSQSIDYFLDQIKVHRFGLSIWDKLQLSPYALTYYLNIRFNASKIALHLEKSLSLDGYKADLIHNVRIGREALSYASYNWAKKQDIPFVFTTLHHPRWVGWRYQTYIDLYKKADAVIALTEAEKYILIQLGVEEKRIAIIGHGPVLAEDNNPDKFLNNYRIDQPFVLFLGQHYPYKGYREILKSTRLVWEKFPEINFVFIGPNVKNSEKIFKEYTDPRIHHLGKVDLSTKTNALAACKLLCVPSTQESFGGVYPEAWSFKKPVIGCRIPAVSDVISHGVDGLLINQNPLEIANAICELIQDNSLANCMGEAGYQKVQEKYNWPVISEKVDAVYSALV